MNDQIHIDKSSLRLVVTFGDRDGNGAQIEVDDSLAHVWLSDYAMPSMQDARATGEPLRSRTEEVPRRLFFVCSLGAASAGTRLQRTAQQSGYTADITTAGSMYVQ